MPHYEAQLDWETGERAGAGGTFQVIELTEVDDSNSIDRTDLVDQGTHYHNLRQLAKDIALATGISAANITVEEV